MSAPSLSIVVTARHDNYGGSVEERILRPLTFNAARLSEHGVSYEVVVVEWDPIQGRPSLAEVMAQRLPENVARAIRPIVVAPEYQRALTQTPHPFYLEYIAKNVGIRRARGARILVSNVDVLLGREVVTLLAADRVAPATIYRAPRYDTKLGVDQAGLTWEALENPTNHVTRAVLRPPLYSHGAADFLLGVRDVFHDLRGFNEVYRVARVGIDANFMAKAHGAGVAIKEIPGPVYHINHVGSFRISSTPADSGGGGTTWGKVDWHARHVTYNNPDGWGLGDAPSRDIENGGLFLEFDWAAVPPLVDLRRVVLPARQAPVEPV